MTLAVALPSYGDIVNYNTISPASPFFGNFLCLRSDGSAQQKRRIPGLVKFLKFATKRNTRSILERRIGHDVLQQRALAAWEDRHSPEAMAKAIQKAAQRP
jgi:hypothetical protein